METSFMGFGDSTMTGGGIWNNIKYHFIDNQKIYYTVLVIIVVALVVWFIYKKFFSGESLTMLTETNLKNDFQKSRLPGTDWDSVSKWDDPAANPGNFTVGPPNQK